MEGLRIIERDELVEMEPNISDAAVAALWAPTGGIVCPFGLTFALAENAAKNGVQFRFDTKVTGLHPLDGSGTGWAVETDHGTLETRCIVNAAGVYADTLHNMADAAHPMTITARREITSCLTTRRGQHVRHTVFQLPGKYGKGVLVTPTVHGNLLVGPTAIDVDDKEATATTAAGLDEVRENPASRSRTFRCARPSRASRVCAPTRRGTTSSSARSRPALWTARPSSRPACPAPRPSVRWSRTSCAAVCTYTISPILTRRAGAFWTPKRWIFAARAELIRQNPAYGQIICRCESVTEGEIIDAIRRTPGARSLDGVKRRTRAGMGRCQAGFCSPRVMEILARELGVPQSEITKSGGASKIIVGTNKDSL